MVHLCLRRMTGPWIDKSALACDGSPLQASETVHLRGFGEREAAGHQTVGAGNVALQQSVACSPPLRRGRVASCAAGGSLLRQPQRQGNSMDGSERFDRDQLRRDGYVVLRGAIPAEWLVPLRDAFDAGVKANDQWAVPRGPGWRHASLDLDPYVQAVCRLPVLLAAAGALIGERFFVAQVEGREPLCGGGHQGLHRDLSDQRPGDTVNALAFFDDFGPDNGATRLIPGSHRPVQRESAIHPAAESQAVQLVGSAGDILVFDADLVHAGTLNPSDARRRSILIGYFAEPRHASHLATAHLRSVRMDTSERFDP